MRLKNTSGGGGGGGGNAAHLRPRTRSQISRKHARRHRSHHRLLHHHHQPPVSPLLSLSLSLVLFRYFLLPFSPALSPGTSFGRQGGRARPTKSLTTRPTPTVAWAPRVRATFQFHSLSAVPFRRGQAIWAVGLGVARHVASDRGGSCRACGRSGRHVVDGRDRFRFVGPMDGIYGLAGLHCFEKSCLFP